MAIIPSEFPILEYDPDPEGVIGPSHESREGLKLPTHGVICFFRDVIDQYAEDSGIKPVDHIKSEGGDLPIYVVDIHGSQVALASPGVGAPLAAGVLEVLVEFGCNRIITCGGAGVLDSSVAAGHLLIPSRAVRDEGTSYHYLPPAREVPADTDAVEAACSYLDANRIPYDLVKTWTTDAFFRETRSMIERRRDEGCICVEMECAAFFAVAAFKGVKIASILYGGDDVSGEEWDPRHWNRRHSVRRNLLELALEVCLEIP